MIIAGIYSKQKFDNKNQERLKNVVSKRVKGKLFDFSNDDINVVVGATSLYANQKNVLLTSDSLLIGKVFSKDSYEGITQKELEFVSKKTADLFVKKYWGNYIFIKSDSTKKQTTILRDPVGQSPLFYMQQQNGEVIFSSEISVICELIGFKPDFNLTYCLSFLMHTFISTEKTPFEGIYELPHGCQLTFSEQSINASVVWNPLDYCHKYQGLEKIKDEVIKTTTGVMKSWISYNDSIFLDFSGGTDSTSLLFLIHSMLNSEQALYPVNTFHPEVKSSDERKYARQIVDEIGINIIEFDNTKNLPLSDAALPKEFKPNWPTSSLTHLKMEQDLFSLAKNFKNPIFISGHGGDHIFLCPPLLESLSDFLIQNGTRNFFNKIKDLASIHRAPFFPLLKYALKGMFSYFFTPSFFYQQRGKRRAKIPNWFVKEKSELEKIDLCHPFFLSRKNKKTFPGKFQHIDTIYNGLASIKGEVRDFNNPIFYPLFSQPLLELSLSIPTHESFAFGYDRYPFRKAVSEYFNTSSVWRKDKGETSGVMQRGLKANEEDVLNLCLEGKMVREGLVDRDLLYNGIQDMIAGQMRDQWSISNLISLELFFNYWK